MTSTSSLSRETEVLQPAKRRNLAKLRIDWCDPDPCDCYAPAPKRCECVSRAGRKRRHHSYVHESRAGLRCAFCDRLRPWEPL